MLSNASCLLKLVFCCQDVDAQEELGPDLRAPLQGGSDGRQEGHPRPQAPRARRAQPPGPQDHERK